jgi:hypothetical protein
MVRTFVKNAISGLALSALFLLVLPAPARAQVLAHSGEVAGTIGYDNTSMTSVNPVSTTLPTSDYFYGGSGGYNVAPYITVLAEYKYDPLVAVTGNPFSWHSQLAGSAARINLMPSKKVVPYAIVGAGYIRLTATDGSIYEYSDGYYVNVGGGASVYLGRHWGVRPEVRYERQHTTYGAITPNQIITGNVADVSGSLFFQFGGSGKHRK